MACSASDKPPRRRLARALHQVPCAAPTCSSLVPRASTARPAAFTSIRRGRWTRALVTHAHSDHATRGHGAVLATRETLDIMAIRLGEDFAGRTEEAAARRARSASAEVTATFHPAGHVLGSAQIAVEQGGFRIVASGDYKRTPDPTCAAFEPVPCDVFITEATFGLPVFRHPAPLDEIRQPHRLPRPVPRAHPPRRRLRPRQGAAGAAPAPRRRLRRAGLPPRGAAPALRLLRLARASSSGALAEATVARGTARDFAGAIVLGPPSAFEGPWVRRFSDPLVCLRLRLDAGPRPRPPARRRAAARHLRPLRLDRADRNHHRPRARPRSG